MIKLGWTELSKNKNVQECDATKVDQGTNAGKHNNTC